MRLGGVRKWIEGYCVTIWAVMSELKWFILREHYFVTPRQILGWLDSGYGVSLGWTGICERRGTGLGRMTGNPNLMSSNPKCCEFKDSNRLCWMKFKKKIWIYYPKQRYCISSSYSTPRK